MSVLLKSAPYAYKCIVDIYTHDHTFWNLTISGKNDIVFM